MEEEIFKKVLPHSRTAEQSVIGAMLYDSEAISVVAEILSPEDFYEKQWGIIYQALLELFEEGKPTDLVTLQEVLKKKDVNPEIYSLEYLREFVEAVFTVAGARSYANIVKEKAVLRQTIKVLEDLVGKCYLDKEKTETIMSDVEQKVFDLLEQKGRRSTESIDRIVLNVLNRIEEASKNGGAITGIPTGFRELDYKLSGLQKSDLILIAARPSMGKTAFALSLCDHFAVKKGIPTAIFSLEMSKEQLVNRFLAMESHVDSQKLRTGDLSDMEWDDLVAGSSIVAESNLIIDDATNLTVGEMHSRCRKYKLEHNIQAVIVDYLQLMQGSRGGDSRQNEVSEISRGLKGIARDLGVPVIALSQLSRGPETRINDHRPQLADLRDSGAIEQDADVVMFIYRDEYYNKESEKKGIAEIIVAKQRNGPLGTVELAWVPGLTKFTDLEKERNFENN